MSKVKHLKNPSGTGTPDKSGPGLVDAFRDVVQGKKTMREGRAEYIRYLQDLRRSSAASPVNRDKPRREQKRRAIKEGTE